MADGSWQEIAEECKKSLESHDGSLHTVCDGVKEEVSHINHVRAVGAR